MAKYYAYESPYGTDLSQLCEFERSAVLIHTFISTKARDYWVSKGKPCVEISNPNRGVETKIAHTNCRVGISSDEFKKMCERYLEILAPNKTVHHTMIKEGVAV